MGALRETFLRATAIFRRRTLDHDLQDELASHLQLAIDEHVARGLTREEATRRARLDFGGVDAAREQHREARGLPTLDSILQDLSYAVRGFRREPGFTLIAVAILALGIGANTAVFSVINPLLLRPLPFRDAGQLVWIERTFTGAEDEGLSGRTFQATALEEMQRNSQAFDQIGGYFAFYGFFNFTLTGRGDAERLVGVPVGPNFFETLGVQPFAGRLFAPNEMKPKGPSVVLLSHALWQTRFASDPAIVGQPLTINNQAFTVVGILPPDFDFSSTFTPGGRVDFFLPCPYDNIRTYGHTMSVVGRLKPGVSLQGARAEFDGLIPRLNKMHPEWGGAELAKMTDLKDHVAGGMRRPLFVLWAAVGLVLLIVCANLSNLLLARTAARSKEFAVRMALGAGRARVLRQLLTEGIVLSLFGAALGIPLAFALTGYLKDRALLAIPLLSQVKVDGQTLIFTAAVAVIAGIAFGMIPALKVSGRDLNATLKDHNRGSTESRNHAWVRSALVIAEVAVACVLLVGAGLLLRSFMQVLQIDLGFKPSQAFALHIQTPDLKVQERWARLDALANHVRALPGIEGAGITDALPLDRNRSWGIGVPGQMYNGQPALGTFVYLVGPGYMKAMGIPLKAGREFAVTDSVAPLNIIINESLVRRLFPHQSNEQAIGKVVGAGGNKDVRIVGVVADVRQSSLDEAPAMQTYFPSTVEGDTASYDLIIRSTLPNASAVSSVRGAIATFDPAITTLDVRPLDNLVEHAISPRKFLVTLLGGFSLLALTLACLGIYGVVSYTVSQRVQEIGVRMALGATAGDVGRQVIGDTLRLATIGIALGLIASLALARLIASLLFGTSPGDITTFVTTALALAIVAIFAGAVPAFRAATIDPMRALRAD